MAQKRKTGLMTPGLQKQIEVAQRHAQFDQKIVHKVVHQHPGQVFVQATKESRQLYNLYNQVMGEHMKLTCYLRLQINSHGILYAKHTPLHQVEDLLVSHFLYRFPLYTIIIGSKRGTFIGKNRAVIKTEEKFHSVIARLEKEQPTDPLLKELKETDDDVWEAFYQSQYVKEKHNEKLFKKNIPKRFLSMDSFNVERKMHKGAKGLEEFL